MKILLLEPNRSFLRLTAEALRSDGHIIMPAITPQMALDILEAQDVDIVVSELLLANHSGIEVLQEIRSQADWRQIPIVFHTKSIHVAANSPSRDSQYGILQIIPKSARSIRILRDLLLYTPSA